MIDGEFVGISDKLEHAGNTDTLDEFDIYSVTIDGGTSTSVDVNKVAKAVKFERSVNMKRIIFMSGFADTSRGK